MERCTSYSKPSFPSTDILSVFTRIKVFDVKLFCPDWTISKMGVIAFLGKIASFRLWLPSSMLFDDGSPHWLYNSGALNIQTIDLWGVILCILLFSLLQKSSTNPTLTELTAVWESHMQSRYGYSIDFVL